MNQSARADLLGEVLGQGRYLVQEKLGEGGMGAAYAAVDQRLNRTVVIKAPHARLLQDSEVVQRFSREIQSLVALSHPGIVPILDVGEHNGLPFAVLQYLSGGSLESRRKQLSSRLIQSLPAAGIVPWIHAVAETLDFIHARGYVHRDVKPGNILFDEHGRVVLADFGIAKGLSAVQSGRQTLTGAGMAVGTVEYMAPEVILGQPCDGRADQYALGIVAYELLTGRRPFENETATAVLVAHTTSVPPDVRTLNPAVPEAVAQVIAKALAKSPADRYATCREFSEALAAAAGGAAIPIAPGAPVAAKKRTVVCPSCKTKIGVAASSESKAVTCAKCGGKFRVSPAPMASARPSETARVAPAVTATVPMAVLPPTIAGGNTRWDWRIFAGIGVAALLVGIGIAAGAGAFSRNAPDETHTSLASTAANANSPATGATVSEASSTSSGVAAETVSTDSGKGSTASDSRPSSTSTPDDSADSTASNPATVAATEPTETTRPESDAATKPSTIDPADKPVTDDPAPVASKDPADANDAPPAAPQDEPVDVPALLEPIPVAGVSEEKGREFAEKIRKLLDARGDRTTIVSEIDRLYREASLIAPRDPRADYARGLMLDRPGSYDDSIRAFEEATMRKGWNYLPAWRAWVITLQRRGDSSAALAKLVDLARAVESPGDIPREAERDATADWIGRMMGWFEGPGRDKVESLVATHDAQLRSILSSPRQQRYLRAKTSAIAKFETLDKEHLDQQKQDRESFEKNRTERTTEIEAQAAESAEDRQKVAEERQAAKQKAEELVRQYDAELAPLQAEYNRLQANLTATSLAISDLQSQIQQALSNRDAALQNKDNALARDYQAAADRANAFLAARQRDYNAIQASMNAVNAKAGPIQRKRSAAIGEFQQADTSLGKRDKALATIEKKLSREKDTLRTAKPKTTADARKKSRDKTDWRTFVNFDVAVEKQRVLSSFPK